MTAWGRTGRVTLAQYVDTDGEAWPDYDVHADGDHVGRVQRYNGHNAWGAEVNTTLGPTNLTLDAAVMWVLRRAAPDVWRAERGPVWRVSGSGLKVRGLHWRATVPEGDLAYLLPTWADAMSRTAATS